MGRLKLQQHLTYSEHSINVSHSHHHHQQQQHGEDSWSDWLQGDKAVGWETSRKPPAPKSEKGFNRSVEDPEERSGAHPKEYYKEVGCRMSVVSRLGGDAGIRANLQLLGLDNCVQSYATKWHWCSGPLFDQQHQPWESRTHHRQGRPGHFERP